MTQEYTWILEYIKPFIRLFKCVSFKNDALKSWSIYLQKVRKGMYKLELEEII